MTTYEVTIKRMPALFAPGIDKSVWSLYPELERIPSGKAQDL